MEKIKIVQILRAPQGGIRKHVLEIIDNLDRNKFDSFLITNINDGDIKFNDWKKNKSNVIDYPIVDNPGLNDIKALVNLYRVIKKMNVDILHGHGAKGGLYARIIGKLLGIKVIYTAHGGSLHSMHGAIKNIFYKIIECILYYLTNVLMFESKYSMEIYSKNIHRINKKFILNYNSIEINQPDRVKDINLENIKVGAFGLLRKIKGHDLLIKAISSLIKKGFNIELEIFGNGEEQNNLEELIRTLGVKDKVSIKNYCENVQAEMQKCDIIAHPSLFESFGYVPLEALNEGITVVSSLEGGLREVMNEGENGFCTPTLTVGNLESALETAILNEKLRIEKYEKSKVYIKEKFDFKNFIKTIEETYIKCLH